MAFSYYQKDSTDLSIDFNGTITGHRCHNSKIAAEKCRLELQKGTAVFLLSLLWLFLQRRNQLCSHKTVSHFCRCKTRRNLQVQNRSLASETRAFSVKRFVASQPQVFFLKRSLASEPQAFSSKRSVARASNLLLKAIRGHSLKSSS